MTGSPIGTRRLAGQGTGAPHQWRKCRSPVVHHGHPGRVGRRDHLAVATEPPGWTTAVTPARPSTSRPSGNGKKASLAPAPPRARSPALVTAISAATTRDCWPAPTPTAWPSVTTAMALDVVRPQTRQASSQIPPLRLGRRRLGDHPPARRLGQEPVGAPGPARRTEAADLPADRLRGRADSSRVALRRAVSSRGRPRRRPGP